MKQKNKIIAGLAVAVVYLTAITAVPVAHAEMSANGAELVTNGPQTGPGDRSDARSPAQNVRDSERYEGLVHSNSGYRAARERKECGPIGDARLHADCVASFSK
jgi:hypothetical protein